jgi:hypothetical protein
MRLIFIFFLLAASFTFACNTSNSPSTSMGRQSQYTDSVFKVFKIDSINNYYLVYAKKNDSIFKIVSTKNGKNNCLRIKKNKKYQLSLQLIWKNSANTSLVTGTYFDDSTVIRIDWEKEIYALYSCDNLHGLCYSVNR